MKRLLPRALAAMLPLAGILSASGEPDWTGWCVVGQPAVPPPATGIVVRPLAPPAAVQAPLAEALSAHRRRRLALAAARDAHTGEGQP